MTVGYISRGTQAAKELFWATRPASFPMSLLPVLLVPIVTKTAMFTPTFACVLLATLLTHAGANLSNSYFDFLGGVDTVLSVSHGPRRDVTLVQRRLLSPRDVLLAAVTSFFAAGALVLFLVSSSASLSLAEKREQAVSLFLVGALLAFFYTARPLALKTRGLGDVVVFLCFGPLLVQLVALLLTGDTQSDLVLFSLPLSLLTVAIVHSANTQAMATDRAVGVYTLATLLGLEFSLGLFAILVIGSFLSAVLVASLYAAGGLLVLPALFAGWQLLSMAFSREKEIARFAEHTAKLHLLFGSLYLLGLVLSDFLLPWTFFVVWLS